MGEGNAEGGGGGDHRGSGVGTDTGVSVGVDEMVAMPDGEKQEASNGNNMATQGNSPADFIARSI